MDDKYEVEISPWAYIEHTPSENPTGGAYSAYDRETKEFVGRLSYFYLRDDMIMFKEVHVEEPYRRRRVATALLRYMNADHPDAQINPGTRNAVGEAFMKHILETEEEKVSKYGVLNVPLQRLMPPGFRPSDTAMRIWGPAPTGGGTG